MDKVNMFTIIMQLVGLSYLVPDLFCQPCWSRKLNCVTFKWKILARELTYQEIFTLF